MNAPAFALACVTASARLFAATPATGDIAVGAVHCAVSVMFAVTVPMKSHAVSPCRHSTKVYAVASGNKSQSEESHSPAGSHALVGVAGAVAVPPCVTVCAATALPPALSNVTVNVGVPPPPGEALLSQPPSKSRLPPARRLSQRTLSFSSCHSS